MIPQKPGFLTFLLGPFFETASFSFFPFKVLKLTLFLLQKCSELTVLLFRVLVDVSCFFSNTRAESLFVCRSGSGNSFVLYFGAVTRPPNLSYVLVKPGVLAVILINH